MSDTVRVHLTISDYHYKRLKLWSALHAKFPTTFAAQLVTSAIEENAKAIDDEIARCAAYNGCSTEEMIKKLLEDN